MAMLTAGAERSLSLPVLLDTGADACLFPLFVAHQLGIDLSKAPKSSVGGVGSTSNVTYYASLTVDLGQAIRIQVFTGFTQGMNAQGVGLLGQEGFFSLFDVCFSHRDKSFTVELP